MLKFLTHKLRTHSINEDNFINKGDEDHDSGTESDEQIDNPELTPEIEMSEQRASVSPADTGCSGGSPPPSMDTFQDPHSSEEELEVINSPKQSRPPRPTRAASVCLPEKRKWSQINTDYSTNIHQHHNTSFILHHQHTHNHHTSSISQSHTASAAVSIFGVSAINNNSNTGSVSGCGPVNNSGNTTIGDNVIRGANTQQIDDGTNVRLFNTNENEENMSHYGNLSPRGLASPMSPYGKTHESISDETPIPGIEHSGSSDDEVHHLLHASMSTPVQFRTSPPLEALKPAGQLHGLTATNCTTNNRISPPSSTIITAATIATSGNGGVNNSTTESDGLISTTTTGIGAVIKGRSLSPPPKLLHCELSPRKRSRHTRHSHVQRPCLDFEKMQQLKARGVTAWRHNGDHSGELSVFCW